MPCGSKRGKGCLTCHTMSLQDSIENTRSKRKCATAGGKCSDKGVVYAAECTHHNIINVGYTQQKLSNRFTGHRSDTKLYPNATELAHHFHKSSTCDISRDLRVTILQQGISGSKDACEFQEDRWITRLGTKYPNGMNIELKHMAKTYYDLFE